MTIADADYYDAKFDWQWSCSSCLFTHTSKGFTCADIDEAQETGVRCPSCATLISEPRRIAA